jgi:hypothetical protein
MGADLYIKKLSVPRKNQWTPIFNAAVKRRDEAFPRNQTTDYNDPQFKILQAAVEEASDSMYSDECYFRDSYNSSSVMAMLNLSWWRDVIPLCDEYEATLPKFKEENGNEVVKGSNDPFYVNMGPVQIQKLIDMVEAAQLKTVDSKDIHPDETVEEVEKYFREKKVRLVEFLKRGIEHGGIYASL